MAEGMATRVTDSDGMVGQIVSGSRRVERGTEVVTIELGQGRSTVVPTRSLLPQRAGGYSMLSPFQLATAPSPAPATSSVAEQTRVAPPAPVASYEESVVVPVMEEEAHISRQAVESGGVRLHKSVRTHEEVVDIPLRGEEVEVTRHPVNQPAQGPVPIRYEGDVMIVPLLEEVIVVEKRLMVKEELHIRRKQVDVHHPQTVTLRTEEVSVERMDRPNPSSPVASPDAHPATPIRG